MLPAVQKIVGRYFAHREQECPSGKGSFFGKVNKSRKTGFYGPRMLSLEPVKATCHGHLFIIQPTTSTCRRQEEAHHEYLPPLHITAMHSARQSPSCQYPGQYPPAIHRNRPTNGPEIVHKGAQTNKVKELHQPQEVIRKRGTGKFKELYKIEEIIIGKRGARFARIRVT
jgi:hypothetical protein